jgi:hypothetical protein
MRTPIAAGLRTDVKPGWDKDKRSKRATRATNGKRPSGRARCQRR